VYDESVNVDVRTLDKKPPQSQPYPQEVISPLYSGHTVVLVATGPSLTPDQLELLRALHTADRVKVFTINNTFMVYPWTDVHLSCDGPWWRWYWHKSPLLRYLNERIPLYTWYPEIANDFGIKYIKAITKDGLSTDPGIVHINHGSGPMMMNLAYLYGARKMVLLGHDMRFAPDYDARRRYPGSFPRHFFGEYPKPLQHWPSVKIPKSGHLQGLIETYEKMRVEAYGIEVINCTPESALTMYPYRPWEEVAGKLV
jgi:hypothetical protein